MVSRREPAPPSFRFVTTSMLMLSLLHRDIRRSESNRPASHMRCYLLPYRRVNYLRKKDNFENYAIMDELVRRGPAWVAPRLADALRPSSARP
jgi:hypothetical protein